jgi:heptaprenyl diphosphate synthase
MDYYHQIMGADMECFVPNFNDRWASELSSHETDYSIAKQLKYGNRLRPILVAWGYYANHSEPDHRFIAEYAICVELIHKASILLDDVIDTDNARHGMPTFHKEYSDEEAILYAIYLINKGLKNMSVINSRCFNTLLHTINDMAVGSIKEVTQDCIDIHTTKAIIDLETTKLIQNSLVIGYMASQCQEDIPECVLTIGEQAGYCFQLLNDLEPFMRTEINRDYKKGHNYDFNKNRKNIVIAYLFGASSNTERQSLSECSLDYADIRKLIDKYDINSLVLHEVDSHMDLIAAELPQFERYSNMEYMEAFKLFLKEMFRICFKKLGLRFKYIRFDNG